MYYKLQLIHGNSSQLIVIEMQINCLLLNTDFYDMYKRMFALLPFLRVVLNNARKCAISYKYVQYV